MNEPQRFCEAPDCETLIPEYLIFCRGHWLQLPAKSRARINRATRRLARHPRRGDRLRSLVSAREEARQLLLQGAVA